MKNIKIILLLGVFTSFVSCSKEKFQKTINDSTPISLDNEVNSEPGDEACLSYATLSNYFSGQGWTEVIAPNGHVPTYSNAILHYFVKNGMVREVYQFDSPDDFPTGPAGCVLKHTSTPNGDSCDGEGNECKVKEGETGTFDIICCD